MGSFSCFSTSSEPLRERGPPEQRFLERWSWSLFLFKTPCFSNIGGCGIVSMRCALQCVSCELWYVCGPFCLFVRVYDVSVEPCCLWMQLLLQPIVRSSPTSQTCFPTATLASYQASAVRYASLRVAVVCYY